MKAFKPTPTLLVIVGVAFCVKLAAVLTLPGMIGVDGGAYLLSLWSYMGYGQIADFPRPPLAPGLLLWPFVTAFGVDVGLKLFHVLASLSIVGPFYLFARLYLKPWLAVLATVGIMVDWQMTELFVVGALPMLGFSLIILSMWAAKHLLVSPPSKGYFWTLALSLPLIAFTNQTSVPMAAIILPVYTLGEWAFNHGSLQRLVRPVLLGCALAASALPWYMGVAPGSDLLRYPGPLITLTGDGFHWYYMTIAAGILAGVFIWGDRNIKALAPLLFVFVAMSPWVSYDETVQNIFWRARYFMMLPATVAFVWLMHWYAAKDWGNRIAASGVAVLLFGLLLWGAISVWLNVSRYTQMVTPATARAIAYIQEHSNGGKVLANHYSMALYASALTKQPVVWTQIAEPPPAYYAQHMYSLCILGWADCNPMVSAKALNVEYIIAEQRWPTHDGYGRNWLAPEDAWELTDSAWWLEEVYREGTTVVWHIREPYVHQ